MKNIIIFAVLGACFTIPAIYIRYDEWASWNRGFGKFEVATVSIRDLSSDSHQVAKFRVVKHAVRHSR